MRQCLDENALDLMFRKARTQNDWLPLPVESKVLEAIWDDARMGPTSANCSPARMVFVTTKAAKEKLRPRLDGRKRRESHGRPCHGNNWL